MKYVYIVSTAEINVLLYFYYYFLHAKHKTQFKQNYFRKKHKNKKKYLGKTISRYIFFVSLET